MSEPALTWNPRRLREQPIANFRRPTDDELGGLVDTLADLIGEKAELPSWQRRLAIGDGNEILLLLDVPTTWISPGDGAHDVAPEPGQRLRDWLGFAQQAFPLNTAVELLAGRSNPELELTRRREILAKRDEIRAQHKAKKDAEAAAEAKEKKEAEERKTKWREPAWNNITPEQRLVLSMSLAVEKRDPALAEELRDLAALQGGFLPLPRTEWWLPAKERKVE